MVLVGTIKYYLRNVYAYFDSFWILNPMGFIPVFCLVKTLYLVGNWRIDDKEEIGNMQMDANTLVGPFGMLGENQQSCHWLFFLFYLLWSRFGIVCIIIYIKYTFLLY